jgi:uncharacterized protein YjbI with pentapeptide repeats
LNFADLAGADLQGTNFRRAQMFADELNGALLTGLGPYQTTNFYGAGLGLADFQGAVCGSPNYIVAAGATLPHVLYLPAACQPPL